MDFEDTEHKEECLTEAVGSLFFPGDDDEQDEEENSAAKHVQAWLEKPGVGGVLTAQEGWLEASLLGLWVSEGFVAIGEIPAFSALCPESHFETHKKWSQKHYFWAWDEALNYAKALHLLVTGQKAESVDLALLQVHIRSLIKNGPEPGAQPWEHAYPWVVEYATFGLIMSKGMALLGPVQPWEVSGPTAPQKKTPLKSKSPKPKTAPTSGPCPLGVLLF